jgi:adenylate cyclase class 2
MAETELKYRLEGAGAHERLRGELTRLGGRRLGRHREENRLYDSPRRRLRRRGQVLRLRTLDGGPGGVLTLKGPADFDGAVKRRDEHEVAVADADGLAVLLAGLGYRLTGTYRKLREEWRLDGVLVALDQLAFGRFVELEGPAEQIVPLAEQLGLRHEQAERAGYPTLAARYRAAGELSDAAESVR